MVASSWLPLDMSFLETAFLWDLFRNSLCFFFFQAEDGIRDWSVTGVQTCALPICSFSAKTWAFYAGAANDCITRDANRTWYEKIWLRPRLLRDVAKVSTKARIMGHDVEMPFMISPAALAKLSHPDGELAMARAAVAKGVAMCVSVSLIAHFHGQR